MVLTLGCMVGLGLHISHKSPAKPLTHNQKWKSDSAHLALVLTKAKPKFMNKHAGMTFWTDKMNWRPDVHTIFD